MQKVKVRENCMKKLFIVMMLLGSMSMFAMQYDPALINLVCSVVPRLSPTKTEICVEVSLEQAGGNPLTYERLTNRHIQTLVKDIVLRNFVSPMYDAVGVMMLLGTASSGNQLVQFKIVDEKFKINEERFKVSEWKINKSVTHR